MTGASCRNEGCEEPRRVRRGAVDPLCEDCYRQALARVAAELAGEQHPGRVKQRFKRFENNPGQQPDRRAPALEGRGIPRSAADQRSAAGRSAPPL